VLNLVVHKEAQQRSYYVDKKYRNCYSEVLAYKHDNLFQHKSQKLKKPVNYKEILFSLVNHSRHRKYPRTGQSTSFSTMAYTRNLNTIEGLYYSLY